MIPPADHPAPLARLSARERPAADPDCAGCPQLGTFRALRRAGVAVQGGLGCDRGAGRDLSPSPGQWAAVAGAFELSRRGAPALVAEAERAGARLLVLADRLPADGGARLEALLAGSGVKVERLDPADLGGTEAAVRRAADRGAATALLALAPCVRGDRRAPALAIDPSRCNRCGACIGLACPAISDPGGEALAIDPAVCSGCGLCAPLCRPRAIAVGF
jgi:TPP-dependent indolepyruvate ferredoxin oxidoreductase alpha subunit